MYHGLEEFGYHALGVDRSEYVALAMQYYVDGNSHAIQDLPSLFTSHKVKAYQDLVLTVELMRQRVLVLL